MTLYRVENARRNGPYLGAPGPTVEIKLAANRHFPPSDWENEHEVMELFDAHPAKGTYRFAFDRLDTLYFVFGEFLDANPDFSVVVLEAEPLCYGPQDQVIFLDTRTDGGKVK